jgi:hypothetical protein
MKEENNSCDKIMGLRRNNSYDFEMMGLYRISEYENTGPERPFQRTRKWLISIVSILLVAVGMTTLISSSTFNWQQPRPPSASQIQDLKSPVSSDNLPDYLQHDAGNG